AWLRRGGLVARARRVRGACGGPRRFGRAAPACRAPQAEAHPARVREWRGPAVRRRLVRRRAVGPRRDRLLPARRCGGRDCARVAPGGCVRVLPRNPAPRAHLRPPPRSPDETPATTLVAAPPRRVRARNGRAAALE